MSTRITFSEQASDQLGYVSIRLGLDKRPMLWTMRIALARSLQTGYKADLTKKTDSKKSNHTIETFRIEQNDGLLFRSLVQQHYQKPLDDKDYAEYMLAHVEHGLDLIFNETEKFSGYDYLVAVARSAAQEINLPKGGEVEEPISEIAMTPEIEDLAQRFLKACEAYNIKIDECNPAKAITGPNVYRFYVKLASGQKISMLRRSLEDIEREMQRSNLIVTSIQDSSEIAFDVPRTERQIISIKRGLVHLPIITSPEEMPILIGVTPEGEHIIRDLNKMPHLLIGGTTGAGKSVLLKGLIISLLKTHSDPMSIELLVCSAASEDFSLLEGLPHLASGRVVSDTNTAIDLLQNQVRDVAEGRQQMLQDSNCANITEYNAQSGVIPIAPYVVIVDEFADLADQLASDVSTQRMFYTELRRIAQAGRKWGIHLILCTQRPSANLLPTNIRSLMNARIALRVNDRESSKMILDDGGAEQLQMNGDLFFKEESVIKRVQSYYVSTSDLNEFLNSFKSNPNPK